MSQDDDDSDVSAIRALIERQFASVGWAPGQAARWDAFAADFFENAALYPAARPARAQTVESFVERMQAVLQKKLHSFHETALGSEIRVFGNVAVASAGCETTENGSEVNRGVEMLLLVKDEGRWQIVAQAWDGESEERPLPAELAADNTPGQE